MILLSRRELGESQEGFTYTHSLSCQQIDTDLNFENLRYTLQLILKNNQYISIQHKRARNLRETLC